FSTLHDQHSIEQIFPLTAMQQGMIYESSFSSNSEEYIEQFKVQLHGDLDLDRLQHAWRLTAEEYPALRTAFILRGVRQPLQIVKNQPCFDWKIITDQGFCDESQWDTLCKSERAQGFTFDGSLMNRFFLVKAEDNSWNFAWTYHHII